MPSTRAPMSAPEILAGIHRWTEIESFTRDTAGVNAVATRVAADFAAAGTKVERVPGRDGLGDHLSIRSAWGGDGAGILVLCHYDTVHPKGTLARDLPIRVEGDRAYGPGIYDMKGGAFLPLVALRNLAAAGKTTRLPIRLLYVSDEEIGSPTSRALIEKAGDTAKWVLVTEPARDGGRIVTARKGVGRYEMTVTGKPSHAGARHEEGISAILELAKHVVAIEARTDYARGLTFNVGQIHGGTADNVVPQHAGAAIDMRVKTMADGEELARWLKALKPFHPKADVVVTGGMNRPPFEKNAGVARLFEHARNVARDIGIDLVDMATGGGSDGNFVAHRVPTLDGLGVDGNGAHTHEEHLLVSSLVPRATLMQRLFETLE